MTEAEVLEFVASLPGVVVETASAGSGAPAIAWGDSFVFDAASAALPADRRWPFATVVTKDYPGFDESSDLDREGVFRVNVNVGKERFAELVGYPPSEFGQHEPAVDPATLDTLVPHPAYGQQGWVAVVSPGARTDQLLRTLLTEALDRVAARH